MSNTELEQNLKADIKKWIEEKRCVGEKVLCIECEQPVSFQCANEIREENSLTGCYITGNRDFIICYWGEETMPYQVVSTDRVKQNVEHLPIRVQNILKV